MTLEENLSYYDILEIHTDASPQEIRAAYLRLKLAYGKDSLAHYTLLDQSQSDEMLKKIEEAFRVLSSPEKRKTYDQHFGLKESDIDQMTAPHPLADRNFRTQHSKVISIDRTPPMDIQNPGEDLLVAPPTDFSPEASPTGMPTPPPFQQRDEKEILKQENTQVTSEPLSFHSKWSPDLLREIESEIEWKGEFLKKVRESMQIPIEELVESTKISKTYLTAIEEDNFKKLPAAVFLRGFLIQIAKKLGLPHEKVAVAYLTRYREARPDKA